MSKYFSEADLDELFQSDEYMEFLMERSDRPVYNGDMLLQLAEEGYMFEEFIEYFEQVCREREAE